MNEKSAEYETRNAVPNPKIVRLFMIETSQFKGQPAKNVTKQQVVNINYIVEQFLFDLFLLYEKEFVSIFVQPVRR
jgi:hypothetical protein